MPRFTISNIAKHISHNPDDDYDADHLLCAQFTWDYENEKIDKIASEEFRYELGDKKKSLMWVQKLKEIADWKEGEYIYAYTKTNADGYYNVFYRKDKVKFSWFNTIIEPSGYVCMKAYNNYTMDDTDDDIKCWVFVRVNSVYNDKNWDKPKEKAKPKKEADCGKEEDNSEYMQEDMGECPKCDCAVKRKDLAWRSGYYLDICAKCDDANNKNGVAIDNGEVPACATCGYEMDPFLICLLNFGNHNQSVYHCTECLDERAAAVTARRNLMRQIHALFKAESDDEDSE
jgi:hypothetical protein